MLTTGDLSDMILFSFSLSLAFKVLRDAFHTSPIDRGNEWSFQGSTWPLKWSSDNDTPNGQPHETAE